MSNISFAKTTRPASRPAFVVDPGSIIRDTGRQIDWDALDSRYTHDPVAVEVSADADIGDTSIDVEALDRALTAGEVLDFGLRPAITVTTTAQANAAATSISVSALSGPIRAGTVLDFTGAGEFALVTADAAAGATSLTVEALDAQIESGDTATVPAARVFARVTADAEIGDTSVTVESLDNWVNEGDVAYVGTGVPGKQVRAGTVMDLLSNGKIVPSALGTGGVTAYGILETNADESSPSDAASGYGVICGGFLYENLLPEASGSPAVIDSNWKTELRNRGGAYRFEQYSDDTSA